MPEVRPYRALIRLYFSTDARSAIFSGSESYGAVEKYLGKPGCILLSGAALKARAKMCWRSRQALRAQHHTEGLKPAARATVANHLSRFRSIPHHDTLMNLLDRIYVEQIQEAKVKLLRSIEYTYQVNGKTRNVDVHMVICQESCEVIDPETAQPVTKKARHLWLSSSPLNQDNVHPRRPAHHPLPPFSLSRLPSCVSTVYILNMYPLDSTHNKQVDESSKALLAAL